MKSSPLFLALLAPFACSPAQTPTPTAQDPKDKTPAQQGDEQTKVPSEFARFVRKDDGGHLDTAVITYRNKDGAEVTLLGAVHIADRAHYLDLQQRFERCDALLYELVGPENYRPKPGEHGGSWVSMLQSGMKNALDLEFQLDAVDYDKPNFVHADMTPREFSAAQEKAGESILGLMWKAMVHEMQRARDGENEDPGMAGLAKLDLVTAFQQGEGRHLLRMLFASQLQNVERIAAGFGPDGKGSVLVEGRNEKCLTVLQRELKAGKRKLGIYYGAAHLPHMEQRLVKDLGFTKVKQEWLVAWDCTKRPDKKPDGKKPGNARLEAKLKKAQADVRIISDTIKLYLLQNNVRELPTMATLTTKDAKGNVAIESSSRDPWGCDYEIRRGERLSDFEVVSAGPDGQMGTEDDISSKAPDAKQPGNALEAAKLMKARADVRAISDSVKLYLLVNDVREVPTLETLTTKDKRGNVAIEGDTKDPWGTVYEIRRGERLSDFEVLSAGPDRKFGTEDDISSRKLGAK